MERHQKMDEVKLPWDRNAITFKFTKTRAGSGDEIRSVEIFELSFAIAPCAPRLRQKTLNVPPLIFRYKRTKSEWIRSFFTESRNASEREN